MTRLYILFAILSLIACSGGTEINNVKNRIRELNLNLYFGISSQNAIAYLDNNLDVLSPYYGGELRTDIESCRELYKAHNSAFPLEGLSCIGATERVYRKYFGFEGFIYILLGFNSENNLVHREIYFKYVVI